MYARVYVANRADSDSDLDYNNNTFCFDSSPPGSQVHWYLNIYVKRDRHTKEVLMNWSDRMKHCETLGLSII